MRRPRLDSLYPNFVLCFFRKEFDRFSLALVGLCARHKSGSNGCTAANTNVIEYLLCLVPDLGLMVEYWLRCLWHRGKEALYGYELRSNINHMVLIDVHVYRSNRYGCQRHDFVRCDRTAWLKK